MQNLKKLDLIDTLNEQVLVKKKTYFRNLSRCQLLLNHSEENENIKGFGWINGEVKKFRNFKKFPSTHVGWNEVLTKGDPIFENLPQKFFMYFNHSYFPVIKEKNYPIANTNYSSKFVSIFKKRKYLWYSASSRKKPKIWNYFFK